MPAVLWTSLARHRTGLQHEARQIRRRTVDVGRRMSLEVVRDLLGHASIGTTSVYVHAERDCCSKEAIEPSAVQ